MKSASNISARCFRTHHSMAKCELGSENFSTFHQSAAENLCLSLPANRDLKLRCDCGDTSGTRFRDFNPVHKPSLTHTSAALLSLPSSCLAAHHRHTGQEGIMPLFLLRSAIVRRLWLDTRLLLASFLRRSITVSRVCP